MKSCLTDLSNSSIASPAIDEARRERPVSEAQLVERRDGAQTRRFPLNTDVTSIGRGEDNHIVLTDPLVSRHHAEVRWQETHWLIRDLGSRNGTYVNGLKVDQPTPLRRGDLIAVGDLAFTLESDETMEARAVPGSSVQLRIDLATAQIWSGGRAVQTTAQEYRALALLHAKHGMLVTKEELSKQVWPEYAGDVSDETIAQLISRLRRKIEPRPDRPRHILTVRGLGYRLVS